MRYCLYAGGDWVASSYPIPADIDINRPIPASALPEVMHSGLTNWSKVFDGHLGIPSTVEDFERFDVIHVNMSSGNVGYIRKLKRQMELIPADKRPLIVANPDYAIEMWNSYQRLDLFLQDIALADRIFCVHSTMSNTLSTWLGRYVYTIPHPTNVNQLREKFLPLKQDKFQFPTIMVISHAYDMNVMHVTETVDRYRKDVNPDIRLILVGHVEKDKVWLKTVYDEVHDNIPFTALMPLVARMDCVIDTALTHSYGRIGVECAALKTPCIGNVNIESIGYEGHVDIYNAEHIYAALDTAFSGKWQFTDVSKYNYARSKDAFERMVYNA